MKNKHERKLSAALSNLAAATLLVITVAGTSGVMAQTATLHAPMSNLRPASMPSSGFSVNKPLAAPEANLTAQTVPAIANPNVKVGAMSGAAKAYALKAQVVPGAAMNAMQKLAAARAALAEIEKQAKEQQDKETEAKIALLQQTLSIGNSATLSLLNPKSPIGNATLSVHMADRVDFERNQASFNPGSIKKYGSPIGWPAAYCHFKAPEDGFYMVAYTVENFPNVGGTTTVTAGINRLGKWGPENEAKATLNKGVSIVAVVQEFRKGDDASSRITSDDIFGFIACEISRLK